MKETYRPMPLFADAVWPQSSLLKDIALVLIGSWLVAIFAQIQIPLNPVPITGQTFAVLLVGALLGKNRAALSLLAYLLQGTMGIPVFAGAGMGITHVLGPTGGYLIGFAVAAYLIGWLSEQGWDRRIPISILTFLIGNITIYLIGLPWLAFYVGIERVLPLGLFPFLIGDLVKICLAAFTLPAGWTLLSNLSSKRPFDS